MEKNYCQLKEKLIEIVREIVSSSFCPKCDFDSFFVDCPNCGYQNKELNILYSDLKRIMIEVKPYFDLYKNKLSLILFPLKDYNVIDLSFIDDDFEFDLLNNIDSIVKKINNGLLLSNDDISFLSLGLKVHAFSNETINNYVILGCLNKTNVFDKDVISAVISLFAENMFDAKKMNLRCFVDNLNGRRGVAKANIIRIDSVEIDALIDGKMDAFFTLFHEYVHVLQHYRQVVLQNASVEDIKQIKETIIGYHNKSFYSDNKFVCSFEKEANILGNSYLIHYLDSVGFPIVSFEEIKRVVDNDTRYLANDFRVVGDDKVLIDKEFLNVVTIRDFNYYPQLSYEYKVIDSRVVLKSLDEIYSDIDYINSSPDFDHSEKKALMDIYKDIVSRYPVKKKKNKYC